MARHRPRARWELYVRPAVAAVFIIIYWVHHDAYPPDLPPRPPAWVEEQGADQGR